MIDIKNDATHQQLRDELTLLWEIFTPVFDWYCGENEDRKFSQMLADAIDDLRKDRTNLIIEKKVAITLNKECKKLEIENNLLNIENKTFKEDLERIAVGELTDKNCLRCMSNKNIAKAALEEK